MILESLQTTPCHASPHGSCPMPHLGRLGSPSAVCKLLIAETIKKK